MADNDSKNRGPGVLGLPLGAVAAFALVTPALISFALLRIGIAQGRGGVIATGGLVGAFWLMMLVQTAFAVSKARSQPDG